MHQVVIYKIARNYLLQKLSIVKVDSDDQREAVHGPIGRHALLTPFIDVTCSEKVDSLLFDCFGSLGVASVAPVAFSVSSPGPAKSILEFCSILSIIKGIFFTW